MSLRDQAWRDRTEIMAIGMDAPHRSLARFGPIVCVDLGVPHAWGVHASSGLVDPSEADADSALAWLRDHGGTNGWQVRIPEFHVPGPLSRGLAVVDRIPVLATESAAAAVEFDVPLGMTIDDDPSYADVIDGYGGWMSDRSLAELLVLPTDLELPDRRFVVGHADGRVVGCAFIWFAGSTGYLSGIGVIPDERGRGYGRALTAVAARLAAHGTQIVMLHATAEGAALYGRMGFERVDTEVALSTAG